MQQQVTDKQFKEKFAAEYHHLIEERMQKLDNGQHSNTTTSRHKNRLRNKVIDDLIKEQAVFSEKTKDKSEYTKCLVRMEEIPNSHFWKTKLLEYDEEDRKKGPTKEERLIVKEFKKRKLDDSNGRDKMKKKMKSIVVVPQKFIENENSNSKIEILPRDTTADFLKTFIESTMHRYGHTEYKVPTNTLPPRYSEINPDATTLFIKEDKLDAIVSEKICAQEKRHKLIEAQEIILPREEDYDFHDFDMKKLDGDNYGDLGFDF